MESRTYARRDSIGERYPEIVDAEYDGNFSAIGAEYPSSLRPDKRPITRLYVHDRIREYLNWLREDWFRKVARANCTTQCIISDDKAYVSPVQLLLILAFHSLLSFSLERKNLQFQTKLTATSRRCGNLLRSDSRRTSSCIPASSTEERPICPGIYRTTEVCWHFIEYQVPGVSLRPHGHLLSTRNLSGDEHTESADNLLSAKHAIAQCCSTGAATFC